MTLHIALVGAESTGKSQLGVDLLDHLRSQTRLRCALVGEFLREWCEREGRTPHPDEQRSIAEQLRSFDLLVNDLSMGLPAEIKARQRQYEYYRDKLLTFEEFAA